MGIFDKLFGPPDIEKLKDKRDIDGLIKALGHKDDKVSRAAVHALGKLGDARAVEPLIAVLRHHKWCVVRAAAADALGKLGDSRAGEPLIAALKDDEEIMSITRGLAEFRLTGETKATAEHIAALMAKYECTEAGAAELLRLAYKVQADLICDPEWVDFLTPFLAGDKWPDMKLTVGVTAAKALGELGDRRAVNPLATALKGGAELMCKRATAALARLGGPEAELALAEYRRYKEAFELERPKPSVSEIGILFDIDELEGGFYGWKAYKILFNYLDPKQLIACTLFDGDTAETLAGHARLYCIAVQSLDASKTSYVKEILSQCGDKGLLPVGRRFLQENVTSRHPLVLAGEIDSSGNLVVRKDSMIDKAWAEGTAWTVTER